MPDPLAHHPDMLIVRPDSLPRFWWLFPWTVCRQLHKNAVALRELADNQSTTITNQANILGRYMDQNRDLKAEVNRITHVSHYHVIEARDFEAKWLRALEENEALRKKGAQS